MQITHCASCSEFECGRREREREQETVSRLSPTQTSLHSMDRTGGKVNLMGKHFYPHLITNIYYQCMNCGQSTRGCLMARNALDNGKYEISDFLLPSFHRARPRTQVAETGRQWRTATIDERAGPGGGRMIRLPKNSVRAQPKMFRTSDYAAVKRISDVILIFFRDLGPINSFTKKILANPSR